MERQVEICCGGYYDALAACKGKAKRIELNSALALGGLTPTTAVLKQIKQDMDLEVICMVRPRAGGFHYHEADFKIMCAECKELLEAGADGIVFGCLNEFGEIDEKKTKTMVDMIHDKGRTAVFHRAFDCVKDPYKAMELLIELHVDRVLTSGNRADVNQGREIIRELAQRYGNQIEILAGCGVNLQNAKELITYCGITQIHSSCKGWKHDPTTIGEYVSYAYALAPHASDYEVVDETLVKALIDAIK